MTAIEALKLLTGYFGLIFLAGMASIIVRARKRPRRPKQECPPIIFHLPTRRPENRHEDKEKDRVALTSVENAARAQY